MKANTPNSQECGAAPARWSTFIRWYLFVVTLLNLVWESLHLPLYTIWADGTPKYLLFVVFHCTGGDLLIALASLTLSLLLVVPTRWPEDKFGHVAAVAIAAGVGYTIFSEWLNLVVRKSWQYSELMPVVPLIDAGLSPLLQWMLIPPASLWAAHRITRYRESSTEGVGGRRP